MKSPNTHCSACDTPLYRSPSKMAKFQRSFCDMACRNDNPVRWIPYVLTNARAMTTKAMADFIGIPAPSLRTWIHLYRLWGVELTLPKGQRVIGLSAREKIKLEVEKRKLERVQRPTVDRKKRAPKPPKPERERKPSHRGRPPKKEPPPMNIKAVPFDPALHTMIQLNNKTWKQVKKTA